jgi:methionine synthase I (cobalamin-dependent)
MMDNLLKIYFAGQRYEHHITVKSRLSCRNLSRNTEILKKPEIIANIHRWYIETGSQIV